VELRAAADNFLNMWRTECEAGMRFVGPQPNSPSAGYAWLALAGNMLWAAAPLIPGILEGEALYLGIVGAGVNSSAGLLSVYERPDPTAANISAVQQAISLRLAAQRDAVNVSAIVDHGYQELVKHRGLIGDAKARQRREGLWSLMFTVPYANGSQGFQTLARTVALRFVSLGIVWSALYEAEMLQQAQSDAKQHPEIVAGNAWLAAKAGVIAPTSDQLDQWVAKRRGATPFPVWLSRRGVYRNLGKDFGVAHTH